MRTAITISLSKTERTTVRRWSRHESRLGRRARIVLRAAEGLSNKQIAHELDTDAQTVGRWRTRFATLRLGGIATDAPRSGRKRRPRGRIAKRIQQISSDLQHRGVPISIRKLAKAVGVNHMLVHRMLKEDPIVVGPVRADE